MSRMEFDFCVAADHPSLAGHFPGRPVVPGVLVLDHVLQALSRLTGQDVTLLRQVKFTAALLPAEQAQGVCEVDGTRVSFHVVVQRQGTAVAIAQGTGTLSPRAPS